MRKWLMPISLTPKFIYVALCLLWLQQSWGLSIKVRDFIIRKLKEFIEKMGWKSRILTAFVIFWEMWFQLLLWFYMGPGVVVYSIIIIQKFTGQ